MHSINVFFDCKHAHASIKYVDSASTSSATIVADIKAHSPQCLSQNYWFNQKQIVIESLSYN